MFGPLGVPELIFIFILALLIFGPRRLPEIGRTMGKAIGEFRRATNELKRSINTEIALEDDEERPRYQRNPRPKLEAVVSPEGVLEAPGAVARGEAAEPPAQGDAAAGPEAAAEEASLAVAGEPPAR